MTEEVYAHDAHCNTNHVAGPEECPPALTLEDAHAHHEEAWRKGRESEIRAALTPLPRIAHLPVERFHEALVSAGVVRDGEKIRRIVIDAKAGEVVVMHVERFGDERLLDVVRTLDGIEVREERRVDA